MTALYGAVLALGCGAIFSAAIALVHLIVQPDRWPDDITALPWGLVVFGGVALGYVACHLCWLLAIRIARH